MDGLSLAYPALDCSRINRQVRRGSESQSEVSSIDTEVSESVIAARLGVDAGALVFARFKIDRQKLENMIRTPANQTQNQADVFFSLVQHSTTTHINWPSRLKIDAKSKKDVHVKISGMPESVKTAKEQVLELLDSRGSRVTMKIDISYTDHSFIIGKGGENIKHVMASTNTHIHFPDSNRGNKHDKSNQVSLNGTLEGVEKARALVRATAPLIISFELPVSSHEHSIVDTNNEYVNKVKETFGVEVMLSNRQKLHNTLVLVKGSEKNASKVREATQLLITSMCATLANHTRVNLQLEISPQHHDSVKGKQCSDLLQIMNETKTKILFSDVKDLNIAQLKKSQVIIIGSIDGVYKARQQLIGNLPVALSFDYPEHANPEIDTMSIGTKYGVLVTARPKVKQNSNSIVIRGKEKFIDKIYEARHELLKLTTPLVKAEIPLTYFASTELGNEFAYMQNLGSFMSNRPETPMTPNLHIPSRFGFNMDFQNLSSPYTRYQNIIPRQTSYNSTPSPNSTLQPQPRSSLSPKTSDYGSALSSCTSLDKLNQAFLQQSLVNAHSTLKVNNSLFDDEITPTMIDAQNAFNFDKKLEGYKTMQRGLNETGYRTPTNTWAGLGLSKTSPFALESVRKPTDWDRNEASPYNFGNSTGIVDPPPSNLILGHHKDMHSLLMQLGLEHYISTFHINEIDLDIFSTLTPENLTTLGIQAFGARKKLLMAINQLNASKIRMNRLTKFSGSAAPGAERRTSGDWL